jgi:catabolite regulation protein CreA
MGKYISNDRRVKIIDAYISINDGRVNTIDCYIAINDRRVKTIDACMIENDRRVNINDGRNGANDRSDASLHVSFAVIIRSFIDHPPQKTGASATQALFRMSNAVIH